MGHRDPTEADRPRSGDLSPTGDPVERGGLSIVDRAAGSFGGSCGASCPAAWVDARVWLSPEGGVYDSMRQPGRSGSRIGAGQGVAGVQLRANGSVEGTRKGNERVPSVSVYSPAGSGPVVHSAAWIMQMGGGSLPWQSTSTTTLPRTRKVLPSRVTLQLRSTTVSQAGRQEVEMLFRAASRSGAPSDSAMPPSGRYSPITQSSSSGTSCRTGPQPASPAINASRRRLISTPSHRPRPFASAMPSQVDLDPEHVLRAWIARTARDAAVYANLALRWDEEHPAVGVDPAPPDPKLRSLRAWEPGHTAPRVAVEVVSRDTAEKDCLEGPASESPRWRRSSTPAVPGPADHPRRADGRGPRRLAPCPPSTVTRRAPQGLGRAMSISANAC